MISAFWEMFKPLYAVYTLEGYTENEIAYLKELFGALPRVLEDYYRAAGRTKAFHCVQDTWMLPVFQAGPGCKASAHDLFQHGIRVHDAGGRAYTDDGICAVFMRNLVGKKRLSLI